MEIKRGQSEVCLVRNRLVKFSCLGLLGIFLGVVVFEDTPAQAVRVDRELPVLVSVGELLSEPKRFDGHRVVVSGRVRDISLQKGRRGGNYIVIRLESLKNNPKETHPVVKVFSLTPAPVLRGHEALVQGKYFVRGRAAGLPFENFIQADAIMREPAPQNQG